MGTLKMDGQGTRGNIKYASFPLKLLIEGGYSRNNIQTWQDHAAVTTVASLIPIHAQ